MSSELVFKKNDDASIIQYDISVIPNDFNVTTIYYLIDSGAIEMPVFQRNYIWDVKRASKFIESLVLGLPIPQIFLYQKARNKFLVIDGQQRLLTIYYFIKQRFPLANKRAILRKIFDDNNGITEEILMDGNYFKDFKLQFGKNESNLKNPLEGLKYSTLDSYKSNFEFMTMRCMAIRQNEPKDDDSSVFEIFSRLNTGGINLTNQEIRACLYYSKFFNILNKLNRNTIWRNIYGKPEDGKFKDVEFILRMFAVLCNNKHYTGSMNIFINKFAKQAMSFDSDKIDYLYNLFLNFLEMCKNLPREVFTTKKGELNIALFECIFTVVCEDSYKKEDLFVKEIDASRIIALKSDKEFEEAITHSTAHTKSFNIRLSKAKEYLNNIL